MSATSIYIIDDNETVCSSLKFLLNSLYKIDVYIYHDPLLFLSEYSTEWRGCLVIDLFMPFLDGIGLIQELKKRNNQMKVIMISGNGDLDAEKQALDSGAYAYFNKPFSVKGLLERIDLILKDIKYL